MDRTYLHGDLYYAELGKGVGSEQEGYRPVVIIQNDIGNRHSPTVIVAAITSKVGVKPKLPTHYYINAEDGLESPSVILLEQLRTVDKHRLDKYIGHLKKKHIDGINHALAVSIGLIHPIPQKLTLCVCNACIEHLFDTGVYRLRRIESGHEHNRLCVCCHRRVGTVVEIEQRDKRR
ncbi:MAG: type II toxin-antitoxin system PemK/MazF family toxin [Acutalibacter sp.]|nr:type II toxin-antitoxin system PemK/MazF family toxin [Acutalibacter sp.]